MIEEEGKRKRKLNGMESRGGEAENGLDKGEWEGGRGKGHDGALMEEEVVKR